MERFTDQVSVWQLQLSLNWLNCTRRDIKTRCTTKSSESYSLSAFNLEVRWDISTIYSLIFLLPLYFIEIGLVKSINFKRFILDKPLFNVCKELLSHSYRFRYYAPECFRNGLLYDHHTHAIWSLPLFHLPFFIRGTLICKRWWRFSS